MITPEKCVWDFLCETDRTLVLYGTGNGADKILDECLLRAIEIKGVFASDGFVRKRTFRGFEVMSFSDCLEKHPDMLGLMSFGTDRPEVMDFAKKLSDENRLLIPEVPVCGNNVFDRAFFESNYKRLANVRNALADEQSVKVFDGIIAFRLTGDIHNLFGCETPAGCEYELLNLTEGTSFIDLGAYRGDTAEEFISNIPLHRDVIAVEPDSRNYKKLALNPALAGIINPVNAIVTDSCKTAFIAGAGTGRGARQGESGEEIQGVSLDFLAENLQSPIYVKADIEGNELEMIRGGRETIQKKKPYMKIDCYHRSEDLFTIPEAVFELNPGYRLYMRHSPYLPSWETAYIFIPE